MPLIKDTRIITIIDHLTKKFGASGFVIKDHWEGDLCAIGFCDPDEQFLLYLSVFDRDENFFYVSLENPCAGGGHPYEPGDSFDNVSLSMLESIFERHLRLNL